MSDYSFKLPDLGEGTVESEVCVWHVVVGDVVAADDVIADVQTDKAVVEVTAPVSGRILSLGCAAGDVLQVGAELVRFEVDDVSGADEAVKAKTDVTADATVSQGEAGAVSDRPKASASSKQAPVEPNSNMKVTDGPVLASPSLRYRARELGIRLEEVPGSGPRGRISHEDLARFIEDQEAPAPQQIPVRTGVREQKVTGMRRVIARKMSEAKRTIPHYSYIEEVDVTELESLRAFLNGKRRDDQTKLTLLPFIVRALVRVLPDFPHCNAHYHTDAEMLTEYDAVHVGIATMTPAGLVVPVLRHCEALDAWGVAAEIARVSGLAREGKASAREISGSTISITSLGALGGLATTPVINAPETSIIGINKMQRKPVVRGDQIEVRTMMNISASFDHRIVDGFDGAQLVQAIRELLENPGAIFV